jgi:hypothetical protein
MSNKELEDHFLSAGINEGRFYNKIRCRKDFVNLINSKGPMLEIGPLDNPQLDYKSPDYYSLDVFTREELIKNYFDHPDINKDNIIEPTYIISNNDYSQIKQKFACIFSSHNIEHMPCLVTFLNNLYEILDDDGRIYLIVPDKRYCFDYFKRETDIYDILQAYYEKNRRPKFSDVLKKVCQVTHNDPVNHWNDNHGTINNRANLVQNYSSILSQFDTGIYIDSHVSLFTPRSFMEIISILTELKLIKLKVHKIYHTLKYSFEFYVILKKSGTN